MEEERICITMLKKDLQNHAQFVPENLYNEKVFSIIIIELRRLIATGETIKMNADIFKIILNMYPDLLRAFDENFVEKTIIEELKEATTKIKTVNDISKKYKIDEEEIDIILKKIKEKDIDLYNEIKDALKQNEKQKKDNILEDINNLEEIISLLGYIKNNILSADQKVKLAYLVGKYLHNSLEDICAYVIENKINNPKTNNLFNGVLKLTHLYRTTTSQDTIENIILNNSWHHDYDREKFFGIKNGVPTIDNKYGKNAELLTLNMERVIIETLNGEEIPLKDVVVKVAFREFFKDSLFEYISKLKSYDQEFKETKEKARK